MKKVYKPLLALSLLIVFSGCVETFEAGTENYENTLVIESTITNEHKYHEIFLSRTFRLESSGPSYELNATVAVVDESQNTYNFQEIDSGRYQSVNKFSVVPNLNYQLQITTTDGKKYESVPTQLTSISSELSISANKEVNSDGEEGVVIYADSFDPTNESKYYRFLYDETYKIIAPNWSPLDGFGVSLLPSVPNPPPYHEVYTLPKTKEEQTCYGTSFSNEIIQTNTNLLSEDRVVKFPILFIAKSDFKITHRYSIQVKQLVESIESYSYYQSLNKLSGSESTFSQRQQGFLAGNVYAVNDPDQKVLGYFEVASVLSERLFFNFEDFFPGESKPRFIVECDVITPDLDDRSEFGSPEFSPLIKLLLYDNFKFVDFNDPQNNPNNPFFVVRQECGDCTALGSNIKPTYWID